MIYEDKKKNIFIKANEIHIGDHVNLGNNINVRAHGKFTIGSYSKLGDNTSIEGNKYLTGEHFMVRVVWLLAPVVNKGLERTLLWEIDVSYI